MGFLDKKERIFDIQLTDKGRELLSKGNLNFTYYAFSDFGIDYSGSLSASLSVSGTTFESNIEKTFTFEADQRKNKKFLDSYLFSIPSSETVVPEFKTSLDASLTASLERRYKTVTLKDLLTIKNKNFDALAVLLKREEKLEKHIEQIKEGGVSRTEKYVLEQKKRELQRTIEKQETLVGRFIDGYLGINQKYFLNTKTGETISVDDLLDKIDKKKFTINVRTHDPVEVLTGLETQQVHLKLVAGSREIDSKNGFLIEVYLSGADGKLTRMYKENIVDSLNDDEVVREGFSKYLHLWVDKHDGD